MSIAIFDCVNEDAAYFEDSGKVWRFATSSYEVLDTISRNGGDDLIETKSPKCNISVKCFRI